MEKKRNKKREEGNGVLSKDQDSVYIVYSTVYLVRNVSVTPSFPFGYRSHTRLKLFLFVVKGDAILVERWSNNYLERFCIAVQLSIHSQSRETTPINSYNRIHSPRVRRRVQMPEIKTEVTVRQHLSIVSLSLS